MRLPGGRLCLLEQAGALPRTGCDEELSRLSRHRTRQVLRHHGRDDIPDPGCGRRHHGFNAEQSISRQLWADCVDNRPESAARLLPGVHNCPDPLWTQSVGPRLYRSLFALEAVLKEGLISPQPQDVPGEMERRTGAPAD